MKLKVFLLGSILVATFFCISRQSQANLGPPYTDPISYPSEHPWQDQGFPPGGDVNTFKISPGIVITVIPTKVTVIRVFQIKPNLEMIQPTPKKIELGHPSQKGND
jgi:hypothetical protein